MRWLLLLALLLPGSGWAAGRRVLSLNLCTDQLLLALADPDQIIGLTRLAADCRLSVPCRAAAAYKAVRGTAEEVIASAPDLVLGGPAAAGAAMQAVRRLGIPVLAPDPPRSFDAIRAQILQVADAIGQPGRGQALAASFDRQLAALPLPPDGAWPMAAILQPNGYTTAAGSLADAVLRRAGLDNYAEREGIPRYAVLPLERLVLHPPSLLVTDEPGSDASLAEAILWHPVLAAAFAGRRVAVPSRLLLCGTPDTLDAVAVLARARLALP